MLPAGARFQAGVDEEARLAMRAGLTEANRARSAEYRDLYGSELDRAEPVQVTLYSVDGVVLGGAYGVVRWRWFDLDVVWLTDAVRGQGAGRALMAEVERAARGAGAVAIRLDTLDFQARGFYAKCGFQVYGELPRYPETHTQYLMVKRLE